MLAFILVALASANLTPLCTDPYGRCKIDNNKYLGSWYEIGRTSLIRNTFEKDCNCVKADYKLKPDGENILVDNTCVRPSTLALEPIVGNAKILKEGRFKVSFGDAITGNKVGRFFQNLLLGPNYVVSNVWTDEAGNYKRSLVTYGKALPSKYQFTWILSRDPVVTDEEIEEYLDYAKAVGFNPDKAEFERTPCAEDERKINP